MATEAKAAPRANVIDFIMSKKRRWYMGRRLIVQDSIRGFEDARF
jgi:hypothetical protein